MDRDALLAMTFIVEISSPRGGSMPTRQSTYGLPRFARDDDWVGGSLMAGHALLAMTAGRRSCSILPYFARDADD